MNRQWRYFTTAALFGFTVSAAWAAAADKQTSFADPKAAVDALMTACAQNDTDTLLTIFGPEGKDIVISGDPSDDQHGRELFARMAKEKLAFAPDPTNPDKVSVSVGPQDWPFPVPLVRVDGRWHFDSPEGRLQILARRIGANELEAIDSCRDYVEAQYNYALRVHGHDGALEYAQKINSSPGRQDGLYWEAPPGASEPEVPKDFAMAAAETVAHPEPFHGYTFRILTAQGAEVRGGAQSYLIKDRMIGGFALEAWPALYGVSGVQTFIVNNDGIVFQKDLGPKSAALAPQMAEFNPDKTWRPVELK